MRPLSLQISLKGNEVINSWADGLILNVSDTKSSYLSRILFRLKFVKKTKAKRPLIAIIYQKTRNFGIFVT